MGLGARVTFGLAALAAGLIVLIYVNAAFGDAPIYPGAESGHLIRALYGAVAERALLGPGAADDTAFSLIIRGLTYLTQSLTPWLRLLGGAAYLGGLMLVFQAVRRNLALGPALGFLLLALAYPFHRFAFAALPEGWYVAALGLAILLTARIYLTQPLIHGLAAGGLAAALTLLKPQGLAVAGAFVLLAAFDLALGRRSLRAFTGRLVSLALGFLVTANGLHLLAEGSAAAQPLSFYLAERHRPFAEGAVGLAGWIAAARGLAAMISAAVLLAAIPAVSGLLRIEFRWLWTRRQGRFSLEPQEITFLFVLLCLVLTIPLTAALATSGDPDRIWGRQFEALVPMLWLAAAPFIVEFEKSGGRRWRWVMAGAPIVGLAGLSICLVDGTTPLARDAAALSAFMPAYFPAAAGLILAAGLAIIFTRWPVWRIWLALFVAMAVVATHADLAWRAKEAAGKSQMSAELAAADAIVSQRRGEVVVLAANPLDGRLAYLKLRARPEAVTAPPAEPQLAMADTVVAVGSAAPAGLWKVIFRGETVTIFAR